MAEKIIRYLGNKPKIRREFYIYRQEEADKKKIQYVPWRKADESTKYVLTDDGFVCELLALKVYTNKRKSTRRHYKTAIGYFFENPNKDFKWSDRKGYKNYSDLKPDKWINKAMKRKRAAMAIKFYANSLFIGAEDAKTAGQIYRPELKRPELYFRKLLKQKEVQMAVNEELQILFEQHGMTKDSALKLLRQAAEIAMKEGRVNDMLKVYDKLAEVHDLTPSKQSFEQTAELSMSVNAMLEQAKGDTQQHNQLTPPAEEPMLNKESNIEEVRERENLMNTIKLKQKERNHD